MKGVVLVETSCCNPRAVGELRRLLPGTIRVDLLLQQLARVDPGSRPMVEAWNVRQAPASRESAVPSQEAQRYLRFFLDLLPEQDRRRERGSALRDFRHLLNPALDLARCLFEEGKHRDLRRLASQLPVIFQQGDLQHEAHAAALLFANAAAKEEVSFALLQELKSYFQRCHPGSHNRFEGHGQSRT